MSTATDREGFEPSKPLPVYRFSRPAPSATRTPVLARHNCFRARSLSWSVTLCQCRPASPLACCLLLPPPIHRIVQRLELAREPGSAAPQQGRDLVTDRLGQLRQRRGRALVLERSSQVVQHGPDCPAERRQRL